MDVISSSTVKHSAAALPGDESWVETFLHEKNDISPEDKIIKKIAKSIYNCSTLYSLAKERFQYGARFGGWAKNGSKGYTDVTSGDIYIGKSGNEAITLGYECVNSKNKDSYREIGLKFAFVKPSDENREKFANEVLMLEAKAMIIKCHLATELSLKDAVKPHYLEVFNNKSLEIEEKTSAIHQLMKEKGKVHFTKPAFDFYKGERFDEFASYYRSQAISV